MVTKKILYGNTVWLLTFFYMDDTSFALT